MDPQAQSTGQTLLVVEDNAPTRIALEAILEALGYTVLMAGDAREAQALYRTHASAISLVMSDLIMPETSGPELFTLLRQSYPDARMVIMSGYPLDDDATQLVERGIRHWIRKPFSMHDLALVIEAALAD